LGVKKLVYNIDYIVGSELLVCTLLRCLRKISDSKILVLEKNVQGRVLKTLVLLVLKSFRNYDDLKSHSEEDNSTHFKTVERVTVVA
jgi:hypothetical protein